MKLAIRYENKLYITKKISKSMIIHEINRMFLSNNIPLHISIFDESMKDENIVASNKYLIDKVKRLNLPKPSIFFEEFIIDELEQAKHE